MVVEPRALQGQTGSVMFGQRLISGLVYDAKGLILVGEKSLVCPVRLYCSVFAFDYTSGGCFTAIYIIAVWSKGMYKVRAKIIKGSAGIVFYWRSVAVERLQQVSKVLLIVEHRLV